MQSSVDLVHTHVKADEKQGDGKANQADDRHGLGRLKPIYKNIKGRVYIMLLEDIESQPIKKHVEADEEQRDGQANQADDRHCLGGFEPISTYIKVNVYIMVLKER